MEMWSIGKPFSLEAAKIMRESEAAKWLHGHSLQKQLETQFFETIVGNKYGVLDWQLSLGPCSVANTRGTTPSFLAASSPGCSTRAANHESFLHFLD